MSTYAAFRETLPARVTLRDAARAARTAGARLAIVGVRPALVAL